MIRGSVVITVLVIIVIVAVLGIGSYFIFMQDDDSKINNENPITFECDSMEDNTYEQAYCYEKIAQQRRDITICEKISVSNLQGECYSLVAEVKNDVAECDNVLKNAVTEEDIRTRENQKQGCIKYIETEQTYKEADCERARELNIQADLCFKMKAIQNDDSSICVSIESQEEKDFCYRHVSTNTGDSSICSMIQTSWIKDLCLGK